MRHLRSCLAALISILMLVCVLDASAQTRNAESVSPLLWQHSMNVFRRFSVDRAKMIEFYGEVLALRPLPTSNLRSGSQMTRFQVGTSEIKLLTVVPNRQYKSGTPREVIGLRVMTFFFPDEAALIARFKEHGYPAPQFQNMVAMDTDPDGQWVELIVVPGAPRETFDRVEVGITVSDLEQSRAFYREFVGLEELAPVRDASLGITKYPYRHGTTTVNLWTFGKELPRDTGSAGIQYVVWNVEGVDTLGKARSIKIDSPLTAPNTNPRTLWLADPDGVTNYFAETATSRRAGAPAPR